MLRIDFVEHNGAKELCQILRAMPEGTRILSIYAKGTQHFAWLELPSESDFGSAGAEVSNNDAGYPRAKSRKGK